MFQDDTEILDWVYGIIHGEPNPSGQFLANLAQAIVRADPENYAILRPGIEMIKSKYPKYKCTCAKKLWEDE